MKKWIFVIGGSLVILIVIALIVGVSNIGPLIKKAVNTYGPEITGTEVHLGDVKVSLFSGEARLKDFYLGNPPGFKSPRAMSMESVYVNVNEKSLAGDTISIEKVEIDAPVITYEKTGRGDNLRTILNNVRRSAGGTSGSSAVNSHQSKGKGKKLLIKDLVIKGGKVKLALFGLGGKKNLSANIPDIRLKNIGNKGRGAAPSEVLEQVFEALYEKITSRAVRSALNGQLRELTGGARKELETQAGKEVEKKLGKATEKLKGLLGQ